MIADVSAYGVSNVVWCVFPNRITCVRSAPHPQRQNARRPRDGEFDKTIQPGSTAFGFT